MALMGALVASLALVAGTGAGVTAWQAHRAEQAQQSRVLTPADIELYRQATRTVLPDAPCTEDAPCWDCQTMGNRICGTPLPAAPLATPSESE